MRNFQDTFETCKRSFISAFSICMTVPSNQFCYDCHSKLKAASEAWSSANVNSTLLGGLFK